MRTTRCFIDAALPPDTQIDLPDALAKHLLRVLRLRVGDRFVLFNGDGRDVSAKLVAAGRLAAAHLEAAVEIDRESALRLILIQGIARGEKMDLILQKATELGVGRFEPVLTERTEVKLDAGRSEMRCAHWRGVIIAACEQCGRARVPELAAPVSLAHSLSDSTLPALRLMLDPAGEQSVHTLEHPANNAIALLVGPEGGLSERDRALACAAGFIRLRLGPRILRTETAALAALAVLQSRFGDFE